MGVYICMAYVRDGSRILRKQLGGGGAHYLRGVNGLRQKVERLGEPPLYVLWKLPLVNVKKTRNKINL